MSIAIASDHAGFAYHRRIADWLGGKGYEVVDYGTDSEDPVDYPRVIYPLAEAVARGDAERGVVLGGSGNGEAIVANRVAGVRCAVCWNEASAELARRHNDANIIAIGQRLIDLGTALSIIHVWLEARFDGGRHERRIRMIDEPRGV